jgi:hypothetical protein
VRIGALALALIVVATGCAFGDGTADQGGANALEVTRSDGSKVEFSKQVRAWCAPDSDFEGGEEGDGPELVYVLGGDPPDSEETGAYWLFARAVEDIQRSPDLEFPHVEGSEGALFVFDPERRYELSSTEEKSSGGLVVEEWGCEKGDAVRISVDAKLGSEVTDEEVVIPVEGEIAAVVGDPVALPD